MNFQDMKRNAWATTSNCFGILLLALVVFSLILSASYYTIVGPFIVVGPLSVGLCFINLSCVRNGSADINDLFIGFRRNFAELLIAYLLMGIYLFLWFLLLFIPAIIKSYAYSMTYYIMADNPNMTASEAITSSRALMDGHKFRLFLFELSFIFWHILAIFTLGILYIWLSPYIMNAKAVFYDQIRGSIEGSTMANESDIRL